MPGAPRDGDGGRPRADRPRPARAPLPDGATQLLVDGVALRPPSAVGAGRWAAGPAPAARGRARSAPVARRHRGACCGPAAAASRTSPGRAGRRRQAFAEDCSAARRAPAAALPGRHLCAGCSAAPPMPGSPRCAMRLAAPEGAARRIAQPGRRRCPPGRCRRRPMARGTSWRLRRIGASRATEGRDAAARRPPCRADALLLPPPPLAPLRLMPRTRPCVAARRVRDAFARRNAAPSPIAALAARAATRCARRRAAARGAAARARPRDTAR